MGSAHYCKKGHKIATVRSALFLRVWGARKLASVTEREEGLEVGGGRWR